MIRTLIGFSFVAFLSICNAQNVTELNKRTSHEISFKENKGQVTDQFGNQRNDVLVYGRSKNLTFHINANGISYQLCRIDEWKEGSIGTISSKIPSTETIYRIDLKWVGTNKSPIAKMTDPSMGHDNFYNQNFPDGLFQVKSYRNIHLKDLYPGIDLHYYSKNGILKYDYELKANANWKSIKWQILGATNIHISSNGSVVIVTPLGEIIEEAPIVFQSGKKLKAKWILDKDLLAFDIVNVDPNLPMIIDPVVRVWGTYYGGNGYDQAYGCTVDSSNNVLFCGNSGTDILLATIGAHQTTIAGSYDSYLAKFNSSGVRLWSTYYGGTGPDDAYNVCVDKYQNVYMAGTTGSGGGTVIATPLGHQPNYGGNTDAFLVKFNSNGVRIWATYYGGTTYDQGNSCTTDKFGNVYMSGLSTNTVGTIIATAGAHQSVYGGGTYDGFLVKFDDTGIRQWATYYGGSSYDSGNFCATDTLGNVFLCGHTQNNVGTIIATVGSHQPTFGGNYDAYLAKFNSSGVRQWGTYYGGTSDDRGFGMATDLAGNCYLTGSTASAGGTVIATVGSHQSVCATIYDGYLVKFNGNGARQWGSYYGGNNMDNGVACATDRFGDVYLIGGTQSNNGTSIATIGSHQDVYGGGGDAYLVKFTSNGIRQWGTYYGGTTTDAANLCAVDRKGGIYLAGFTDCTTNTVIATPGSFQSAYSGSSYDSYIAKFSDCTVNNLDLSVTNSVVCPGNPSTVTASGCLTYTWNTGSNNNSISVTPTATSVYSVSATDENGCNNPNTAAYTITVFPIPTVAVSGGSICSGSNFTLSPNGALTYTYFGGGPVVSPTSNSTYSVIGSNIYGCVSTNTAIATIIVNALPTVSANTNMSLICAGETATLTASGANSYSWIPGGAGTTIIVSPSVTTLYTVVGTSTNGCQNTFTITQNVSPCALLKDSETKNSIAFLYPNPVTSEFTLEFLNTDMKNVRAILVDVLGRKLIERDVIEENTVWNIKDYAPGVYYLSLSRDLNQNNFKLIKQ